jgi:hypothetical protein
VVYEAEDFNLYGYCNEAPLTNTDPTGKTCRGECMMLFVLCCAAWGETPLGFAACTAAYIACLQMCPRYEFTGLAYCTANITASTCRTPEFGVGTSHCLPCPSDQPQTCEGKCPQGDKVRKRVRDTPGGQTGPIIGGNQIAVPICRVELTYSSARCDDCPRNLNVLPEYVPPPRRAGSSRRSAALRWADVRR